jgi:hypothetical protein
MLLLTTAQEAALIRVFEGAPTEADLPITQALYRDMADRRVVRGHLDEAARKEAARRR